MEGNQQVGTVTCENGKIIVVEFDRSYLQGLLDKGDTTTTIAGDFYAQGDVDLRVSARSGWYNNTVNSR